MTGTIPPPDYRCPDCPLCGQETWHDGDGLVCDHCRVGCVRVSMDTRHGPLRYAVDRYDDAGLSWQANLRAVVLTLEALRAVERYGAVRDGQQYQGFRALEAGSSNGHGSPAPNRPCSGSGTSPGSDTSTARDAYRAAARKLHPDVGAAAR